MRLAAAPAPDQDPEVVDRQRDDPDRDLRGPLGESGHHEQRRTDHGAWRDPEDRLEQLPIPPAGDRVQDEVEDAHDEVRDAEDHAVDAEGVGTASDTISIAAIEPNIARRTAPSSGFASS